MALKIVDRADEQTDSVKIYIYENWQPINPDGSNLPFPATEEQLTDYYGHAQGRIHDWWKELQDELIAERPSQLIKMVPVGSMLGKLFTETVLRDLDQTDLYYDGAPHGTTTLYFLASLVHYMSIFEQPAPPEYGALLAGDLNVQEQHYRIHPIVLENYQTIVDFIWNDLQTYTDDNGVSRVFTHPLTTSAIENSMLQGFELDQNYPNPFCANTIIRYHLSDRSDVRLAVYDPTGQQVAVLADGMHSAGRYEVNFDASTLVSGVYVCSLTVDKISRTRRMILIK